MKILYLQLSLIRFFCSLAVFLVACRNETPQQKQSPQLSSHVDSATAVPPPNNTASTTPLETPPIRKDGTVYATSEHMGTRFSINVWIGHDGDAKAAGEAIVQAFAEVERIETLASEWQSQSELSKFNAHAGGSMRELSTDLFFLLSQSKSIAKQTSGRFDPTFYGVGKLWRFDQGAQPPDPKVVKKHLHLVDWQGIELDESSQRGRLRTQGMAVGLGAIAKGYAVDKASQVLKNLGFPHHVVEGGGDTYASGKKAGRPWMIGIQRPDGPGTVGALPISDRSVVTSGDYQRFFEFQGKRYAHILDPRTGWPLREDESAQSVTVVAENATLADGFCTGIAVMGPTHGMKFVESHPQLEAVIIDHDGNIHISSGLTSIFVEAPKAK